MGKVVKAGNINAKAGELKFGFIKGAELQDCSSVDVPIIVLNGVREGPTLLLNSTSHGAEITGIEIIRRITRKYVSPEDLSGSIIAIPVANPMAFHYSSYVTPSFDCADINRVFPGNQLGTTTLRLAYKIWQIVLKSNYLIDLHCIPMAIGYGYTTVRLLGRKETNETSIKMAEAFGLTVTIPLSLGGMKKDESIYTQPKTLQGLAMSKGIPTILIELNDWRRWTEPIVKVGVRGVLNAMKLLGMLSGEIEKQPGLVIEGPLHTFMITANHGGIVHLEKQSGDKVSKGAVIARIFNLYGDEIEVVKSPKNGYICAYPHMRTQAVVTGDYLVEMGCKD